MPKKVKKSDKGEDHTKDRKKESIIDLSQYIDKKINVKFVGGREVQGILKGFDPVVNLVLDETKEFLRGKSRVYFDFCLDQNDKYKKTGKTRYLGLVFARGPTVNVCIFYYFRLL